MNKSLLLKSNPAWTEEVIDMTATQRYSVVKEIIHTLNPSYLSLYKTLNSSDAEVIGIIPCISYFKESQKKAVYITKFKEPAVIFHIKNSPVIVLVDPNLDENLKKEKEVTNIPFSKKTDDVKMSLEWTKIYVESGPKFKNELKKMLLDGIKAFESDTDKKAGSKLYSFLKSSKAKFIGYLPCTSYFKIKGSSDMLESQHVHPYGSPTMLYRIENTPVLMIVGPSLRYNKNVLQEAKLNKYREEVIGITS